MDGFSLTLPESPYPNRLYLQAYAVNEAGMGVGQRRRLKIRSSAKWWGQATKSEGDWMESNWFGAFKYYEKGWLYHAELGWLYSSPAEDGVYGYGEAQINGFGPRKESIPIITYGRMRMGNLAKVSSGNHRTYNYVTERYEN